MQFAFETNQLRTLCESSADAIRELGQEVAYALIERLAVLDAAVSIKDVLVGQPRTFENGDLEIELAAGYRLICRANHPNNPRTPEGVIDWDKVARIKVVKITNE